MEEGYQFKGPAVSSHESAHSGFGIFISVLSQPNTMLNVSSTWDDETYLFKGKLLNLGVEERARKDAL